MAPVSAALSHTSPVRGDQTGTLTSAKDARLSDEPFILDPMKDGLSVSRRTVCFWLSAPTRPITLPSGSVHNLPRMYPVRQVVLQRVQGRGTCVERGGQ